MKRCQLSDDVLEKIIGFSKDCLESFTFRFGGLKSPDGSGCRLDPRPVWAALGRCSATLKKLDIDFDAATPGRRYWDQHADAEDYEDDDPPYESETYLEKQKEKGEPPSFPHLTCLRMGVKALMELMIPAGGDERLVDVLPKGLQELVIRGYDPESPRFPASWKSHIDELVEQMADKLPSLKLVKGIDEVVPNGQDVDHYRNGDLQHRYPNGNKENGSNQDSG